MKDYEEYYDEDIYIIAFEDFMQEPDAFTVILDTSGAIKLLDNGTDQIYTLDLDQETIASYFFQGLGLMVIPSNATTNLEYEN